MQFFTDNVKLKLVKGFDMPEQEYIKGEGDAKGHFKKTGGTVRMFGLTFVKQDEFKTTIEFNTKESQWNKYEDSGEVLVIGVDVINDPFTGKLKTAKLTLVKPSDAEISI